MKIRFLFFFVFAATVGWGQVYDVTYTVTSTTTVSSSGNLPSGSFATYYQSYNTAKQITSGNSAILTVSGFEGKEIVGITLEMRSNTSTGGGKLDMAAGDGTYPTGFNTIFSIPDSKFNTVNWNGAWSTSYIPITRTFSPSYIIQSGEDLIIYIEASENSLYIQEFNITYQDIDNTYCFIEDFSSITTGNNTTTAGSGIPWPGGAIWTSVERAYQAGGAVRLGANAGPGFIQTGSFVPTQSTVEVQFDVKGWTNFESNVRVTLGAQTHIFTYAAVMADPFETVSHTFTGVPTGIPILLKFETIGSGARRVFLDNIITNCLLASSTDHFRSKASGDWSSHLNWESSSDGDNWVNATSIPGANAESVLILADHTITLNTSGIVISNTDVYGSLIADNYNFGVNGIVGTDELRIKDGGFFIFRGSSSHKDNGNARGLIETGGTLVADSNTINGTDFVKYYIDGSGIDNLFRFENGGILDYQTNNPPASTGYPVIFEPKNTGDIAIFRLSSNLSSFGSSTTDNLYHAVLEVNGDRYLALIGNKDKTFEGGIIGEGTLTVTHSSPGPGKLILGLNSGAARLGNSGNLKLTIPHNKLQLNNVTVPAAASVTIESEDSGNPNTFARTGGDLSINGVLDINDMRITNTASGNIDVYGTIKTAHTGGLYGSGSAIVEFESDKVKLRNGSTVEFNGANQSFNNGIQYYHLVFSGTGTKTPNSTTDIHTNGSVTITGNTTVDYSGSRNLASPSGSNNIAFTMDGGRLILGTTGPQPNMQGDYAITGGVVEFASSQTTDQTIRNSPDYKYQNIEITGSNVGASSGNTALKPNGSFIVKTGGVYTVRQNAIKCYDDSPKGTAAGSGCFVIVENGALFRTGNDQGFAGYQSEVGSASSAIDSSITDITLEDGSTVEYLGEKSQEITKDELATGGNHYYNLVISGHLIEPVTGELKVANVLTLDEHTYNSNPFEGKLISAETAEEVQPNILYANKGVQINKGELILETNAQLMQDADAVNSGDIFVQRKVNEIKNDLETEMDYIYWSSPVVDQNLHAFSSGTPIEHEHWGFLQYNETNDYFDNTPDEEFKQAKGYAIRAEDGEIPNTRIFEFKGTPQNADIHIPVTWTSEEKGFNLIGNPYPSNIDIDKFFADNTDTIYGGAFFWTNNGIYEQYQQGSGYVGNNYALYNPTGGIPGTQTGEDNPQANPNGIVKTGQGFLVKAKGGGNVIFKNSQRDTDAGSFYSKKTKDRFWLTLTSPSSIVNTTLIGYIDGATDGYDPDYDADYWGSSDGLYSLIPDRKLIIQGRQAPFDKKDKVKLGADFFESGVYVITLKGMEGIFGDTRILLRDKQLSVLHNLKKGPYKFHTLAGEVNDRFELLYQSGFSASSQFQNRVTVTSQDRDLRIFSESKEIESVKVYNLAGRLIYEQPEVGEKEFKVSLPFIQKLILIVHVFTSEGKRTVEKVVFK